MKESRNTLQKQVILEELCKLKTHPTADDIYMLVKRRMPKISLATVYRNLEKMAENGTILKLEFPGEPKRFDAFTHRHYHFKCNKCQRIFDIEMEDLIDYNDILQKLNDKFKIIHIQLLIYGICQECL